MRSLICAFIVRIWYKTHFLMAWLTCKLASTNISSTFHNTYVYDDMASCEQWEYWGFNSSHHNYTKGIFFFILSVWLTRQGHLVVKKICSCQVYLSLALPENTSLSAIVILRSRHVGSSWDYTVWFFPCKTKQEAQGPPTAAPHNFTN